MGYKKKDQNINLACGMTTAARYLEREGHGRERNSA